LPHIAETNVIYQARMALGLWQQVDFARFLGVSARTVARHASSAGIPLGNGHEKLVRALHPNHPELAAKLAASCRLDLGALGLRPTAPEKNPQPAAAVPATHAHATLVVCAAADALNMVPRDVRPVLATIFGHARSLGVDLEGLAKLLEEGAAKPQSHSKRG
jgi:hypothetical protein